MIGRGEMTGMKKLSAVSLTLCLFLLALAVSLPVQAATPEHVTIDFNDLSNAQFIGTHYAGLQFSSEWRGADCRSGWYDCDGWPAHSPPIKAWTATSNTGRIDFLDAPVSQVGAWFGTSSHTISLEAYDAADNLLTSGHVSSGYGQNAYLSVSDPECRIRYVIIHDTGLGWTLDDFDYTLCASPSPAVPTVPSVPSISQYGAICLGIALVGMLVWKLRKRTASL
jgi:hypothetical protein